MAGRKTDPIVATETGALAGRWNRDGSVAVFRGVPFAKPPVGKLRWRRPEPAVPWTGVRPAYANGPRAIQGAEDGFAAFLGAVVAGQGWGPLKTKGVQLFFKLAPEPKQSEDCLYLTIRTPAPGPDAALPVMVWFHGGDHWYGSANDIFYECDALARRGVVVVYTGYRLGLMGYFAHPELCRESEHGVCGNYGTLDQIAALCWVRDNISDLGGDPDNVTIFGESAGGESVAHMLTSPLARGLFHRAILQSPANTGQMTFLRHPFLINPASEELGSRFADRAVGPGPGQVDRLRRLDTRALDSVLLEDVLFSRFFPAIDGWVLPKSPFEAFLDGDQAKIPLLLGSNADEGTVLHPVCRAPLRECLGETGGPREMTARLANEFPDDHNALFRLYPGLEARDPDAEAQLLGHSLFEAPVAFYARQAAAAGQTAYLYRFVRTPPSPRQTAGACHGAELAHVHGSRVPLFEQTEADAALTQAMGDYWTAFAATGDPNRAPHALWPRYTLDDPRLMTLGAAGGPIAAPGPADERHRILERRILRQIDQMRSLRIEGGARERSAADDRATRDPSVLLEDPLERVAN